MPSSLPRALPLSTCLFTRHPFGREPVLLNFRAPRYSSMPSLKLFFWGGYLFLKFYYWSIIVLQYCVSFCCTKSSYVYAYIPSLLSTPPLRIPAIWFITEHQAELPVLYISFPLALYFTHGGVYVNNTSPVRATLPFPCYIHISNIAALALQIGYSVPFFLDCTCMC